jgi:hypothetical protein
MTHRQTLAAIATEIIHTTLPQHRVKHFQKLSGENVDFFFWDHSFKHKGIHEFINQVGSTESCQENKVNKEKKYSK